MKTIIKKITPIFIIFLLLFQSFFPTIIVAVESDLVNKEEIISSQSLLEETKEEVSLNTEISLQNDEDIKIDKKSAEIIENNNKEIISTASAVVFRPVWTEDLNGSITTLEKVGENIEYRYKDTQVKITFTKVTTPGYLNIREFNPENASELGIVGKAYEITSDMEDGTFKYDLTLPIQGEFKDSLSVKYAETSGQLSDAQPVSQLTEFKENTIIIRDLDHFTIFVITDDEASYIGGTWIDYATQGYQNNGVHYPATIPAGQTTIWDFSTLPSGTYRIYISWSTHSNRTTIAPYDLVYVGGVEHRDINQEQLADQVTIGGSGEWSGWHYYGEYDLDIASNLVLTSVNNVSNSDYVIADEVILTNVAVNPSEIWVDDDYSLNLLNDEHIWGYDAFDSIQDAITAATDGSTIHVAAGTYVDDIWDDSLGTPAGYRITKGVTLLGAQAGNDPAGSLDRGEESVLIRTNGLPYSLYASDITIDGFMFGSSDPNTGGRLIIADNADNVTVRNSIIKNTPSASSGHGVYIYSGADNALIEYNTFYNTAWEAIASTGASNTIITHNYISASGQHAIQWMGHSGNNIEISYNHISGIVGKNAIQHWGGSGTNISHNVIDGGNTMFDGIWLDSAVDNFSVNNNQISDVIYAGINVRAGNTDSIVNSNQIYGNGTGIVNYDSNILNAKNNWWGDATGPLDNNSTDGSIPADNPGGLGNVVSGKVDYSEWAVNSDFTFDAPINLGWNIRSESPNPGDRPVDLACGQITNADFNIHGNGKISQNWEPVNAPTNIKYQRQYKYPSGSNWSTDGTAYTNTYIPFSTFGSSAGTEGEWDSRVRAWVDVNDNNSLDEGMDTISGWSNQCSTIYDRTVPTTPDNPTTTPNPTINLTQNWSWTASTDTNGIFQYLWRIPGDSNGTVLGTSLITNLGEGLWSLFVKAEDNAGNQGEESESVELIVDTTPPPVPTGLRRLEADHSTEHQCGEVIFRQISIPVWDEYTEPDFSHYEYSSFHPSGAQGLNEKVLYENKLENSWLSPADGTYGFAVRTVDLAGNKSPWALSGETLEGSCQITYDSVSPVVTVDSLVINDTTPALSGTYFDEHQIDSIIVTVDGQSSDLAILHTDGTWTLADDILSPLADGLYNVTVEVTDEAGNVGTDTTTDELRIDSIAPTAIFTHYIDGIEFIGNIAYVNDINRLTFTGVYTDPDPSSGLKQDSFVIFDAQEDGSFAFSANGAKAYCSWRSGANTIPLSGLTDTLTAIPFAYCEDPLGEGEYYMTHQVYDSAIRKDIPSITQFRDVLGLHFIIDTTAPTVSITSPLDQETISGTTTVTVDATDLTSGVDRVELSYRAVGDVAWIPLDTLASPYTYDWNTTGYPLGNYELQAEAFDVAGNSASTQIEVGVAAVISGETGSTPYFGQIYVSWFTDRSTTAQVVYDTVPHLFADPSLFNYGYAYTTSVFDLGKTTFHETLLTGLNDMTTYYYRFISAGSPTAISGEMSNQTFSASGPGSSPSSGPSGGGTPSPLVAYTSPTVLGIFTPPVLTLPEEGEVLGEETEPTPEPEKSPPTITTPTPRILGALTGVSPLYFLGGGLLISLILMALLFRRK